MKRCWTFVILLGLMLFPKAAFADITYNPVYGTYVLTEDEYGIVVPVGTVGIQSFGGKFINPQGKNLLTISYYTKRAFGVTNYLKVTFGDGHVETFNSAIAGTNNIPSAYLIDHPSKGVTFQFYSDGEKDHKVFLSNYSLVDDNGTSPTAAPTTAPTPAPTVKPTPAPTVKPTSTPSSSAVPTVAPTSGSTSPPTSPPDPGDQGGTEEPCSEACQNIIDQLECPQWDEYMGEWADMIQSVIPPPPDWDMVADKIGAATINHLANYIGDVPSPPTREEIERETSASLPALDTSVETNDLVPKLPDAYNGGKIVFDLNKDAPTIDVKDESQPFIIEDPLTNMPHDDVGVKVIPGDDRNSTGGFKNPDKVDTGDPAPTPGKIIFELPSQKPPVPNATSGAPPIPSIDIENPPIPGSSGSGLPIPDSTGGIIPIPTILEPGG